MPGLVDIPGNHTARVTVPARGTAATASDTIALIAPFNLVVTGVKWIPAAAVTGANTNYFSAQVINKAADASGTKTVTTKKDYVSGTNSTAFVAEALTLSSTATDLQANAGDVLEFALSVTGTGLASPQGALEISYQPR